MTYILVDCNNYVRRIIERDTTGYPVRAFYNLVMHVLVKRGPVFLIWDGFKGNQKRKELFPGYKSRRTKPNESIFEAFKMVEEVCKFAPVVQIKYPGYEGDDVIASLALGLAKKDNVEIWSTDYDFAQLSAKNPRIVCGAVPKEGVSSDMIPYYKVTVGDSSDSIPGFAGFGDGTWEKSDKVKLKQFIDAIVAGEDETLIGFEMPARVKYDPEQIRIFWKIVEFFDIPVSDMEAHFKIGKADIVAAHEYLKGYMQ